jgi:glucokinase
VSAPEVLVGVDLGGTAIKAGRIGADGQDRERREVAAHIEEGAESVCERIAQLARELGCRSSLGIGVPGLVDRARGLVTHSPNLAPMQGFPLREELARHLGLAPERVHLENDANVAAVGEHRLGGAHGRENVLMVTLGTGIGGGLILGRRLFTGTHGLAAEIGHLCVEPGGARCGCGNRGCLEALASATATQRRAREHGLEPDLAQLCEAARGGAEGPRKLLRGVGRDLGRGLAQAVMLLDLDCFLIGGGFGAGLDVLLPGIRDGLVERTYGRERDSFHILPAKLGADAGWIGAALLAASESTTTASAQE